MPRSFMEGGSIKGGFEFEGLLAPLYWESQFATQRISQKGTELQLQNWKYLTRISNRVLLSTFARCDL